MRADATFSEGFNGFPQVFELVFPVVWTACKRALDFVEQLFCGRVYGYAYSVRACFR